MRLVEIRCGGRCGRVLATVDRPPADWSGHVNVPMCPRHGPASGPTGHIRRRLGWTFGRERRLRYERLRPLIEKAQRTGLTQVFTT